MEVHYDIFEHDEVDKSEHVPSMQLGRTGMEDLADCDSLECPESGIPRYGDSGKWLLCPAHHTSQDLHCSVLS